MDTALILKQKYLTGEISEFEQAIKYLEASQLVKELLDEVEPDVLQLLNRLMELAEIPFTYRIDKVQQWVKDLVSLSYCSDGFSTTGKSNDILSCYNSMITSILIRLQVSDSEPITSGIQWIMEFQNVERNQENKWHGSRIQKYGGCMKSTPCFIGVVKAMIALSDYRRSRSYQTNEKLEKKLNLGLEYILEHQLFKRLSDGTPITKDILKLTYPFSYKTNVIEILRLLKDNNKMTHPRCDAAKEYLYKKQKNGHWQATTSAYFPKGWVMFDKPKQTSKWITYEIEQLLST
jgi:hypothetical protein